MPLDPRAEGVYCFWETYPPQLHAFTARLLTIERVNGNGTVDRLSCTDEEADVVAAAIAAERARKGAA